MAGSDDAFSILYPLHDEEDLVAPPSPPAQAHASDATRSNGALVPGGPVQHSYGTDDSIHDEQMEEIVQQGAQNVIMEEEDAVPNGATREGTVPDDAMYIIDHTTGIKYDYWPPNDIPNPNTQSSIEIGFSRRAIELMRPGVAKKYVLGSPNMVPKARQTLPANAPQEFAAFQAEGEPNLAVVPSFHQGLVMPADPSELRPEFYFRNDVQRCKSFIDSISDTIKRIEEHENVEGANYLVKKLDILMDGVVKNLRY